MTPALDHSSLSLILFDKPFVVCKLSCQETLPAEVMNLFTQKTGEGEFLSVTRTSEEISVVCDVARLSHVDVPRWRCIKIKGPMDFDLTGIMCDFAAPLKKAGISIFATSTWNTDYILVPEAKADEAVTVLKEDGWKFEEEERVEG